MPKDKRHKAKNELKKVNEVPLTDEEKQWFSTLLPYLETDYKLETIGDYILAEIFIKQWLRKNKLEREMQTYGVTNHIQKSDGTKVVKVSDLAHGVGFVESSLRKSLKLLQESSQGKKRTKANILDILHDDSQKES